MGGTDYVSEILKCCQRREQALLNDRSMGRYNRYFDKMRKLARKLIDENRQEKLLPYLESESISVQRDIAGLLFHCYPDLCGQKFREISGMTIETGLPKHLVVVAAAAKCNLKYGVPKDFP
ncbi:MAG: hypothetical protein NC084_00370 [Bacteroides sp.]|nr:hypothetical protein [Eubacterium sp.]MCM1417238.1 hypothetical protein [Roseburia sp.]MCM1461142.1 hypothetical protein [Bacteroides sp.]